MFFSPLGMWRCHPRDVAAWRCHLPAPARARPDPAAIPEHTRRYPRSCCQGKCSFRGSILFNCTEELFQPWRSGNCVLSPNPASLEAAKAAREWRGQERSRPGGTGLTQS
ncbi:hypothetical protein Nmel_018454, partial [Mimus melanotis]